MRLLDGLESVHKIDLSCLLRRGLTRRQLQSLWILLLLEVHMLQCLPPVVRLVDSQRPVLHTAVWFKTFWLDSRSIDRILFVVFYIADLSVKSSPVDRGPSLQHQDLVVLRIVICRSDRLVGHSEQVWVSWLSRNGIERGEFLDTLLLLHLHAQGFVYSLTLSFLERVHSSAAFVLATRLWQHNKIITITPQTKYWNYTFWMNSYVFSWVFKDFIWNVEGFI